MGIGELFKPSGKSVGRKLKAMGINTAINNLENDIVNIVNSYDIPIACKKYVLLSVFDKVEKATEKAIQQESTSASEEENTDAV